MYGRANQPKEVTKRKTRNKSPERDLSKLIMSWLKVNEFDCTIVESKAVYNQKAKRYLKSQAVPGFPDIVGNDSRGTAVYIELKAPGRLSTIKDRQREFLLRKIKSNCFAVCVDGVGRLEKTYEHWKSLMEEPRRDFLTQILIK
jgi:hypothetical protein